MSIYSYQPLLIYSIILAFCFGACMGSFLHCAAWRITRGESFLTGRSHCTSCGHELGFFELIPVISWIWQKGRCRHCGAKISARYLVSEVVLGIISVLCLLRFDLTILCLRNYIFLCVLFLLTITDIIDMIIPDGCHIVAIIAWLAAAPFIYTGWRETLPYVLAFIIYGGGLLAISLVMDRILGRDSLGGGDIKLFAVCGLYLGLIGALFALVFACILGLVGSRLAGSIVGGSPAEGDDAAGANAGSRNSGDADDPAEDDNMGGGAAFPFGPWIAAATAFMLLYGEPLVSWYQGMLGM